MKYKELKDLMKNWTDEQLNCDLCIRDIEGEYYPADLKFEEENDVLDQDHPFFDVDETK